MQWRPCVTRILFILKQGAQQMWQAKEAARCQALNIVKQDTIHLRRLNANDNEIKMFEYFLDGLLLDRHNLNHPFQFQ